MGVKNWSDNNSSSIHPNPFSNYATVEVTGDKANKEIGILIYDVLGREVKKVALLANPTNIRGGMQFTIDRDNLPNGMYFYKLTNKNEIIGRGNFSVQ